jgi:ankyrin repeat protein
MLCSEGRLGRGEVNRPAPGTGLTPLQTAARAGNACALDALLRCGAHIEARTEDAAGRGFTPLMTCVVRGHGQCVALLLQAGADVDARDRRDGRTALHWSHFRGLTDMTEMLLESGADMELRDRRGKRPVQLTLLEGRGARGP